MVFKNKLTFLNEGKRPVMELELGIFKIDKMEELKTFVLGLKEGQDAVEIKRGLNDLYEGSETTKFNAFDGVRATLQADKIEDPKLGTVINEKLDTQSSEIAEMQEHLEIIRFSESTDKPAIKLKVKSSSDKADDSETDKTDKDTDESEEKKDEGLGKSLFLNRSPVSDNFKKLHKEGFKNLKTEAVEEESTGEGSEKDDDKAKEKAES